jgi:hypothetical protein
VPKCVTISCTKIYSLLDIGIIIIIFFFGGFDTGRGFSRKKKIDGVEKKVSEEETKEKKFKGSVQHQTTHKKKNPFRHLRSLKGRKTMDPVCLCDPPGPTKSIVSVDGKSVCLTCKNMKCGFFKKIQSLKNITDEIEKEEEEESLVVIDSLSLFRRNQQQQQSRKDLIDSKPTPTMLSSNPGTHSFTLIL